MFQLEGNSKDCPGRTPHSFLLELTTTDSNATLLMGPIPTSNATVGNGYYNFGLSVSLQTSTVYIVNIITQNSVGASISGPYQLSEFTQTMVHN